MSDSPHDEPRPADLPQPPPPEDPSAVPTRPGLRERVGARARGSSRPVRWVAAGILAVLLVLGIGAAGFAIGHESGSGGDRHGGGPDDGDRGGRGDHGDRGDRSDDDTVTPSS